MSIDLLLRALHEPLAIHPAYGQSLAQLFARKLAGESFDGASIHAALGIQARSSAVREDAAARVAIIPIYGVISQHPQSTGTSADQIGAMLDTALASRNVDGILFDVDSPGGTVAGIPELAAKIRDAAKVKPTAAVANGMAASAGYWLAAQAQDLTVLGSGAGVGSIGVYTIHKDMSKALEAEGVKVTPISAGKYKLEGSPLGPMDEEAMAFTQARVDEVYGMMIKDIAAGRKDTQANVRGGYGEGRMLTGDAAVKAGMADRVGTLEDALARLSKKIGPRHHGAQAADHSAGMRAGIVVAPNLRDGDAERSCMNCTYYVKPSPRHDGGACHRHDFHAMDMWLCDDWEARHGEVPTEDMDMEETKPSGASAEAQRRQLALDKDALDIAS